VPDPLEFPQPVYHDAFAKVAERRGLAPQVPVPLLGHSGEEKSDDISSGGVRRKGTPFGRRGKVGRERFLPIDNERKAEAVKLAQELLPIRVVRKDLPPFDSTTDDVVDSARGVYACLSGHVTNFVVTDFCNPWISHFVSVPLAPSYCERQDKTTH
jgi:hypothetical protein